MTRRFHPLWAAPLLLAGGFGGAVLAQSAAEAPAAPKDRAAIEAIVREYILAHPEIIPQAMTRLQERETRAALAISRKALETPFPGAIAGNPQGDVTLVVFFDFACPYCRQGAADVRRLIAADRNLRVVFRDFPVLSPASEEAATAALSAAEQGAYLGFHDAMFAGQGRITRERMLASARKAGLDEARVTRDLEKPALKAEVRRNLELGRTLGLTGTPSYIIGDQLMSGAVGHDALKAAIARARATTPA